MCWCVCIVTDPSDFKTIKSRKGLDMEAMFCINGMNESVVAFNKNTDAVDVPVKAWVLADAATAKNMRLDSGRQFTAGIIRVGHKLIGHSQFGVCEVYRCVLWCISVYCIHRTNYQGPETREDFCAVRRRRVRDIFGRGVRYA